MPRERRKENPVKYIYRLKTPLGESDHVGFGEAVRWPDSLIKRCWLWKLLNAWVIIKRRKETDTQWQHCFWWPARKVTK